MLLFETLAKFQVAVFLTHISLPTLSSEWQFNRTGRSPVPSAQTGWMFVIWLSRFYWTDGALTPDWPAMDASQTSQELSNSSPLKLRPLSRAHETD